MKKAYIYLLLPLVFCFIFVQNAEAQRYGKKKQQNRFNAGLILGANLSQIDGDLFIGFDKLGLRGGVEGVIYINKLLDINVGFMYVQKGSRTDEEITNTSFIPRDTEILLDYMEAPILLSLKFGDQTGNGCTLDLGVSYGRLINSQINSKEFPEKVSYNDLIDQLNSNEFCGVMQFNYLFSSKFRVGVVGSLQLNKLYEAEVMQPQREGETPQINFMRNYLIGIQAGYRFF